MRNLKRISKSFFLASALGLGIPCSGQINSLEFIGLIDSASSYTASGKWSEAMDLWKKVTQVNPLRADFWLNLGDASYNNKHYQGAIQAYKMAFTLGSELPCFRAMNIAQCYAKLRDRSNCFTWLKTAISQGYPYLDDLLQDSVLSKYYAYPEFKELLWMKGRFSSRTEGWIYDLDFLDWQIKRVAYNPYRRYSQHDFARETARIRQQILRGASDMQVTSSFVRLLAMVGDGHTKLYAFYEKKKLRMMVPLFLQFFRDGLFIVAADKSHADLVQCKIDSVDGIAIDSVIRKLVPYINFDNSNWINNASMVRLQNPAFLYSIGLIRSPEYYSISASTPFGQKVTRRIYGVERDSSTILDWTIPAGFVKMNAPGLLREKNGDKNYWFEYLPNEKTLYFKFNRTFDDQDESLASFSRRMISYVDSADVKKFVIDLRDNSGGNVFLVDSLVKIIASNRKINKKGSLFCLIGPIVFSAAQMFAVFLETGTNVIFAGEPTGSSPNFIGETGLFHLPYSGLAGSISNLFWEYSGAYDRRTWIAPQLLVYSFFNSRLQGRDEALEAVLSYGGTSK